MRKFSSYGPIDQDLHYHVPRKALIDHAYMQLVGEKPEQGGHYITVWASRQRGKTWVMQQVVGQIKGQGDFDVAILTLQSAKNMTTAQQVLSHLVRNLSQWFGRDFPAVTTWAGLHDLFSAAHWSKPLILILDEFDALEETFINAFANEFRDMYIRRINEANRPNGEKNCWLHGLALIGVRSVLGIESVSGSPFNVQRSVHIPNLTFEEVESMYRWYERESGQTVEQAVIERVFYETQGQPGLVSWLGELLTETYNETPAAALTLAQFETVYARALNVLPNNNVLNIVSKARQEPFKNLVLELFRTDEKKPFRYDNPTVNFLYLNGVIDVQETSDRTYIKFPSPLVQKRLFNYFADELFGDLGYPYAAFDPLDDVIIEGDKGPRALNIGNLLRRYGDYVQANHAWLLKDAPRRADLRVHEAVYHFNLYMYLFKFLQHHGGQVWPEFPTGNGQADLIIHYAGQVYGIEIKSFSTRYEYRLALGQAARYGRHLGLDEITLALFIEAVDDANRAKYEGLYEDAETGVTVKPVFVVTGAY